MSMNALFPGFASSFSQRTSIEFITFTSSFDLCTKACISGVAGAPARGVQSCFLGMVGFLREIGSSSGLFAREAAPGRPVLAERKAAAAEAFSVFRFLKTAGFRLMGSSTLYFLAVGAVEGLPPQPGFHVPRLFVVLPGLLRDPDFAVSGTRAPEEVPLVPAVFLLQDLKRRRRMDRTLGRLRGLPCDRLGEPLHLHFGLVRVVHEAPALVRLDPAA